jgi:hypothetical protein
MAIIWYRREGEDEETALEIDVVLSESQSGGAEATEHPVERGASKTDHIRPRPLEIRIDGLVSSAMVSQAQAPTYDAARRAFDVAAAGTEDRAQFARDTLEEIRTRGDVVMLQLGGAYIGQQSSERYSIGGTSTARYFDGMALVDLSFPRDKGTGRALRFSATFRQIETVESRLGAAPVITKTTRAKPRADAGNQNPKASSEPEAAGGKRKLESLLHAMFGD